MGRQAYLSMDFDYVKVQNGAKVVIALLQEINKEYEKTKTMKFKVETEGAKATKQEIESLTKAYENYAKVAEGVGKEKPVPKLESWQQFGKILGGISVAMYSLKNIGSSFSSFTKLETTMTNLAIASRKNLSDIGSMYEEFYQLSSIVPHTANSLAKVTDNLVRTGKSYKDSLQITKETAKLATATGEDLEYTASTVSKLMTALQINAKDTDKVLNTLHSTAIQTASSMESISGGMKQVAGVLGALAYSSGRSGKDLDEYKQKLLALGTAGIGVMNNLGKSASKE